MITNACQNYTLKTKLCYLIRIKTNNTVSKKKGIAARGPEHIESELLKGEVPSRARPRQPNNTKCTREKSSDSTQNS
jgi:hypothetical protein